MAQCTGKVVEFPDFGETSQNSSKFDAFRRYERGAVRLLLCRTRICVPELHNFTFCLTKKLAALILFCPIFPKGSMLATTRSCHKNSEMHTEILNINLFLNKHYNNIFYTDK